MSVCCAWLMPGYAGRRRPSCPLEIPASALVSAVREVELNGEPFPRGHDSWPAQLMLMESTP
jgi:hypothetical protein